MIEPFDISLMREWVSDVKYDVVSGQPRDCSRDSRRSPPPAQCACIYHHPLTSYHRYDLSFIDQGLCSSRGPASPGSGSSGSSPAPSPSLLFNLLTLALRDYVNDSVYDFLLAPDSPVRLCGKLYVSLTSHLNGEVVEGVERVVSTCFDGSWWGLYLKKLGVLLRGGNAQLRRIAETDPPLGERRRLLRLAQSGLTTPRDKFVHLFFSHMDEVQALASGSTGSGAITRAMFVILCINSYVWRNRLAYYLFLRPQLLPFRATCDVPDAVSHLLPIIEERSICEYLSRFLGLSGGPGGGLSDAQIDSLCYMDWARLADWALNRPESAIPCTFAGVHLSDYQQSLIRSRRPGTFSSDQLLETFCRNMDRERGVGAREVVSSPGTLNAVPASASTSASAESLTRGPPIFVPLVPNLGAPLDRYYVMSCATMHARLGARF